MNALPWNAEQTPAWDALCDRSPESWLWHRSEWIRYSEAFVGKDLVKNLSFLVMEGSRVLGLAACFAEMTGEGVTFKYSRTYVPWPVLDPDLTTNERQSVETFIFETLQNYARELGVHQIEMGSQVLPASFYKAACPPACLPNRHGYRSTALDTWVMDLTCSTEALWSQTRKGHKSSIKTGQKLFTLQSWMGAITPEEFGEYQKLHALAAGRVTRSQETFDIMRELVQKGNAMLVGARRGNQWLGFVYIMAYKRSAYYASACKHPDVPPSDSIGHALLWEGIQELKKAGFELLELGPQTYPWSSACADQDKLINISMFKRGFGGFLMPRYVSLLSIPSATPA